MVASQPNTSLMLTNAYYAMHVACVDSNAVVLLDVSFSCTHGPMRCLFKRFSLHSFLYKGH
jgi:hypothetical protein